MQIKELFTVPEGKKVTEKAFARVLISSVCSILLCMACLVSTTWAWFAASIENTGNAIQIGNADVKVTIGDSDDPFAPGSPLLGDCTIRIENNNPPDAFKNKATLYVTLSLDDEVAGYAVLDAENDYKATLAGSFDNPAKLSWAASWFPPEGQETKALSGKLMHQAEGSAENTTETAPVA